MTMRFGVVLFVLFSISVCHSQKPPNIVMLLADDMGWNDIGIHGSEIPTPNMDALAYSGIVFRQHYAQPSCTPSRSALLTGQYPMRYGLQGSPLSSNTKEQLSLEHTLMPQILKRQGYRTHLVGKWHLGYSTWSHMPTRRGFDSFFGYLNGFLGYYDGVHYEPPRPGLDFWSNETESWPLAYGKYLTELISEQADTIIKDHNKNHKDKPMFLLVASNAPHAGGVRPFQEDYPPIRSNTTEFIRDPERRNLADVLRYLDDTLGNLTNTLKTEGMLDDTLIIFLSDNGGPSIDPNWGYNNGASNFPFRGTKMSMFNGGVRVPAILWKSGLGKSPGLYENLFHMVDWLPTLNSAAGGAKLNGLDGVDHWASLTEKAADVPRQEILVEINDKEKSWGYLKNNFKYVKSYPKGSKNHYSNSFWSPKPQPAEYNTNTIQTSAVAKALGSPIDSEVLLNLRDQLMVPQSCSDADQIEAAKHDCSTDGCLFDISKDPGECQDISEMYPDVKSELIHKINIYMAETVKRDNNPPPNTPNSRNYFAPSSGGIFTTSFQVGVFPIFLLLRYFL